MPQLDFSTFAAQIFWLLISFIVLYIVLSRGSLPKIAALKAKRQNLRDTDLAIAATAEREAANLEEQWKVSMAQARARASIVVQDAENRVRVSELDHLVKAKHAIEIIEKNANQSLSQTLATVEAELPKHVIELASKLVSHVSGQNIPASEIKVSSNKSAN
jgi:F-type H+-transporting ATPase subunit b